VGAFALLGISVATYFFMWSTGVGPVGSLVAQGVLEERDPVVLADFDNLTSQAGLGAVVTEALRVDLLESPVLTLVGPTQIEASMRLMGRAPNESVTGDVAREIAVREGIKAIIEGEVASVGSAYQISASVVGGESGEILKAFRETARSEDEVIDAIEELGDYDTGIVVLEEAVALDPEFAMAYRKLSVLHFNRGTDNTRGREAAELAYRYRDRLTDRERYLAEAYYHSNITLDEPAEMLAYRNALRASPDESAALNNLAFTHSLRGEYAEAEPLLERAVGGPGASSVAYFNLARVRVGLGDLEGAKAALADYEERFPTHVYRMWARAMVAVLEGDDTVVHQAAQDLATYGPSPDLLKVRTGQVAAVHDLRRGKVGEARAHYSEGIEQARRLELPDEVIDQALWVLEVDRWIAPERLTPERVQAILDAEGFETIPPLARPWGFAIHLLAHAGAHDRARALLDEWRETVTAELDAFSRPDQARAEASLLQASGQPEQGLVLMLALQRGRECDRCWLDQVAELLEAAGRDTEAAGAWERVRDEPIETGFSNWWPQQRTWALLRLGPIYERLGEREKAAAAYAAFADAWYDADPEFQPMVEEARRRAQDLVGQISMSPDSGTQGHQPASAHRTTPTRVTP
jgi:tetratricopeptide (TPR) repeat protein